MRIGLAADHGGFELKQLLKERLLRIHTRSSTSGRPSCPPAMTFPTMWCRWHEPSRGARWSGPWRYAQAEWAHVWLPTRSAA